MLNNHDLEFEGQESSDSEFSVEPLDEGKKSIIYGLFGQLCSLQNFYSRIQSNYKKVALTWLIAVLIAIGYVFSKEVTGLPFHPTYVALFISISGMFGITLIWFLDIIIYQTYFYGVVVEQIKMEKDYRWLPNINSNIALLQFERKTVVLESCFYIWCNIIFLFIMMVLCMSLINFNVFYSICLSLVFVVLSAVVNFIMRRIEYPEKISPIRLEYLKKAKS